MTINWMKLVTRSAKNDLGHLWGAGVTVWMVVLPRKARRGLPLARPTVWSHLGTTTGRLGSRLGVLRSTPRHRGSVQPAYPNLQEPIKPQSPDKRIFDCPHTCRSCSETFI